MDTALIVGGGLLTVSFLLGYLYSLRYIIRYQVENHFLRVKLFGILTLRRIHLDDIVDIQPVSLWPFARGFRLASIWAEAWPSYVFTSTGVLIRKKSGISRRLILTPRNPDEFIGEIVSRRRPMPH